VGNEDINMKILNLAKVTIASIALTVSASAAFAISVTPDTLLGSYNLANSGSATELQALADLIDGTGGLQGADFSIDDKWEDGQLDFFVADNEGAGGDTYWYANVAPETPGYFMLKFGTGNTGVDDTYFFENIAALNVLAWADSQINNLLDNCSTGSTLGECKLSHITTSVSAVPLPASLPFLLMGMGGMAIFGRKRKT
jgi:hypothetical protein